MSEVKPLCILVTGAAGQIAYSLLYSLAKGDVFGFDQPVSLVLLDIEPVMGVMAGVVMELQDCALPLLREVLPTSDLAVAFRDIDVAILIGSMPRREGMERKDLLKANVHIFKQQGEALSQYSKKTVKVLVVGNPANTNAFVCKLYAKNIPPENFTCLTRLDQNRAQAQVALRVGVKAANVENVIVWGNHSSTQFPDIRHSTVEIDGKKVSTVAAVGEDPVWIMYDFISTVQKRGAEVIAARKLSSALSAAKAISDHLRDWWFGTKPGQIVSMGVASDGSYGIDVGLIYSFPVTIKPDHSYSIVQGLQLDSFALGKLIATKVELLEERDEALKLCEA